MLQWNRYQSRWKLWARPEQRAKAAQPAVREVRAKEDKKAAIVLKREKRLMRMVHQKMNDFCCRVHLPLQPQNKFWLVGHRRQEWQRSWFGPRSSCHRNRSFFSLMACKAIDWIFQRAFKVSRFCSWIFYRWLQKCHFNYYSLAFNILIAASTHIFDRHTETLVLHLHKYFYSDSYEPAVFLSVLVVGHETCSHGRYGGPRQKKLIARTQAPPSNWPHLDSTVAFNHANPAHAQVHKICLQRLAFKIISLLESLDINVLCCLNHRACWFTTMVTGFSGWTWALRHGNMNGIMFDFHEFWHWVF